MREIPIKNAVSVLLADARAEMFPSLPGVYLFFGHDPQPLYIGKAANLRSRIRQYLSGQEVARPQIEVLLRDAVHIEYIITPTEKDALILESSLIKTHQSFFNIDLRDDKSFPWLAFTNEPFPQLIITRKPKARWLFIKGPFTSASGLRIFRDVLLSVFLLRRCRILPQKPCIYQQMGMCVAPCEKKISSGDYMQRVKQAISLIEGNGWKTFAAHIAEEIEKAAGAYQFEKAAKLRDSLKLIPHLKDKLSAAFSRKNSEDFFLFTFSRSIFFLTYARYGDNSLQSLRTFSRETIVDDPKSALSQALSSLYSAQPFPEKIGIYPEIITQDIINKVLAPDIALISVPKQIREFMETNLSNAVASSVKENHTRESVLSELSAYLGSQISSIFCIDASTLAGTDSVVAGIWWEDGNFDKKLYRRFKVKTITGISDTGFLFEVAQRLAARWENSDWRQPSLLLIDGGKGQISSVVRGLGPLSPSPVCAGIIKDRKKLKGEEKLVSVSGNELSLSTSPLALLLKKIRDEAHRFAVSYNRILRKQMIASGLCNIPGVGPQREALLLRHFGTITRLKQASLKEIAALPGMPEKAAEQIFNFLH